MVMNNPANNNSVAASAVASLAIAPPLHPPQPHRPSTSCDRHPSECFTGFCPSCLFDRLSVLDITGKTTVASSSKKPPSSSSAALKAIFKPSSSSSSTSQNQVRPGLLFPELRRTKSFSATKNEALTLGAFEPQRRSCDVRVRNTLWSLFNEDSEHNFQTKESSTVDLTSELGLQRINSNLKSPVFEEETEIESDKDINCGNFKESSKVINEIVEEEEEEEEIEEEETKKVNDFHMEFSSQTTAKKPNRDFKEIAGSFWSAASVFSKKLQKWRQKQKLKKHRTGIGAGSNALPVEKSIGRQLRDTQSEIAEYGYGRRSCDTDPRFSIDAGRFSLDAGRFSVDDPRCSFDEPRASWDGYLIGRTAAPPRMPSMLSVVEDSPVRSHVLRSDTHIPVKKPPPSPPPAASSVVDEIVPGGSAQTREYYSDSSSRRRKSLDRSSSTRKISASVMADIEELRLSASNAKDSISHSNSNSNSLRDDCLVENNFEKGVRDNVGTMECNKNGTKKKSRRWSWNIFGLLHRKNGNKYEEEEEEERRSGVDRTFSGSWNVNVETRNGFDPKMVRSNSSVSWRSSGTGGGGFQRNSVDGYVSGKKKVSKIENGMLKFYLTPSKERRRGRSSNSTRPVPTSQPIGSRNVMNFY